MMRSLFFTLFAVTLLARPSWSAELHVSAKGADTGSGTADAPFATLQRARDEARKLKKGGGQEPATVIVHGGVYEMFQTLQLDPQDSDLTIKAASGERPEFIGAKKVEGFTKHAGEILKADVSKLGLEKISVRQLLMDGERQILARWPNFDPKDPLYGGWAFAQDIPKGKDEGHLWKREMYVAEKDVRHWAHPEDVEIDIFANYGWWNWIVPVKGFDEANRKLILAKDCGYDLHPNNRYHLQNALEELDSPGEWYLDKRTMTLYFWPPQGSADTTVRNSGNGGEAAKSNDADRSVRAPLSASHEVRIPTLDAFIKVKQGAKNITVRGLSFRGCVGTALAFENTERCTVAACAITQCGGFSGAGISIQGGHDNKATGNDISYTGSTGIGLGGGDRKTLTAANNIADNNHIHHIGVLNKNAAGVGLGGVGNIVSHNLIHNGPRMAVQFGGNNLVIEYNRVHHMVEETQDGGAFYTGGRDWISSRGSIIRNNFITDTLGVGQEKGGLVHPFFTWGIYMDDNTGGVDIINNIVARSGRASLHLHNGRDCIVENNIWVDGQEKQMEYDGWDKTQHYIVDHMDTMVKGWESVKDEPAWKNMRGMKIDPREAFFPDGTMMSGNVITKNIIMWHDASKRYVDYRHVTSAHNVSDFNLVWNGGKPIRTPVSHAGKDTGEDVLAGEGFFKAELEGKTPKGWGFNSKPQKDTTSIVHDGALVTKASTSTDPKNSHTVIHSPPMPLKSGGAYRAKLKIKGSEPLMAASLAFYVFENGKGYWQATAQSVSVTDEWQEVEVIASMPEKGTTHWKDWMKNVWLRLDITGDKGSVAIKDITVREAEPHDQWASWQQDGWDQQSVVADPMFVDEAKDDYRLKKDSPAWKLGFKEIPVEKIGLYKDESRASWPVKE